jgi:hypothetical protein
MAYADNNLLKTDPFQQIRCQQHASRTFVDDSFRLLPKNKFLFHVAFNINWPAFKGKNFNFSLLETLKDEINLLVKSVDLPAYTVTHETLNQYNRKKVVQSQHKYGESSISFHDDNMGLINQLWQAYYKYHYSDPTVATAKGAYNKTATKPSSYIKNPYGYNGRIAPFFNYITIYQMARHEYVSYTLVNPIITSWTGGKVAYSETSSSHGFEMKLAYEAVSYDTGYVDSGRMEGFGSSHYDWTPSPLTTDQSLDINTSTSPSFARTGGFGSSDSTSATNTNNTTAAQKSAAASKSAAFNNAASGLTTGSLQGVSLPQSSALSRTQAAQVNLLQTVVPRTTTNTIAPEYTVGQ